MPMTEDFIAMLKDLSERLDDDTTLTDLCKFAVIELCAEKFGFTVELLGDDVFIFNEKRPLGKVGLDAPAEGLSDFMASLG